MIQSIHRGLCLHGIGCYYLYLLYPPQEYLPHQRKARWKKTIDKQMSIVSQKVNSTISEAYLYLTARCKEDEANFKKGKQKEERSYPYSMKIIWIHC
jgi:hypothetical protein